VLTLVSIYWFSRAGPAASVRIYCELIGSGDVLALGHQQVKVPVGLSFFPKEVGQSPRAFVFPFVLCWRSQASMWCCRFLRAEGNLVFESEHASGGHFAAYEKPEALADDLRRMFGKGGPAAGVVPGRDGF
jgi:hypothetical protein